MSPETSQPMLVKEKRTVPTSDTILGSLVNQIPEQKLPDKETCSLISTIFSDLAEAHKHYANVARGIADIAGLISPEQLTLILAAAVPPTLQLVLPPGQLSPLSTPLLPPTTSKNSNYCGRQTRNDQVLQEYDITQPFQLMHLKNVRNIHIPVYLPLSSFVSSKNIYLKKQHPEQRLLPVSALQLLSSTRLSLV